MKRDIWLLGLGAILSGGNSSAWATTGLVAGIAPYRSLSFPIDSTSETFLCEGEDRILAFRRRIPSLNSGGAALLVDTGSGKSKLLDYMGTEIVGTSVQTLDRLSNAARLTSQVSAQSANPFDFFMLGLPLIQDAFRFPADPSKNTYVRRLIASATGDVDAQRVQAHFSWSSEDQSVVRQVVFFSGSRSRTIRMECITADNNRLPTTLASAFDQRVAQHRFLAGMYLNTLETVRLCADGIAFTDSTSAEAAHMRLRTARERSELRATLRERCHTRVTAGKVRLLEELLHWSTF